MSKPTVLLVLCSLSLFPTAVARAQEAPQGGSAIDELAFAHPDLYVFNYPKALDQLPSGLAGRLRADLSVAGVQDGAGFYDVRGDRWATLLLARPLIPGSGVGNTLRWSARGLRAPRSDHEWKQATWAAFKEYLKASQGVLAIDLAELEETPAIAVHEDGRIIQINARRVIGGVLARDNYVTAVLNNGNLVLFGTRNWGAADVATQPAVTASDAIAAVESHFRSVAQASSMREPELTIVTLENGDDLSRVVPGQGYRYRLAWAIHLTLADHDGTWEALVDAGSGELLSFADKNQYATRKVVGGVYPVSNDQKSTNGVPDGVEQPGWPMPFADILVNGTFKTFTSSGGVLSCSAGSITTALSGKFVRMNDNCGSVSETAASGNLDLGFGPGTDCDVPAGHSAGDTHSSRTGFFEVNRIKELARSWLPANQWLKQQITANMNINNACNAFWNGSTINFYRKSTGANPRCGNTGEIAAVFDHEWGHGMDANDALPGISLPGEAPADIYAITRLNDSCIGRGFFLGEFCSGQGDPCLECTGVREADWAKRRSALPHDITWIMSPVVNPAVPGRPPGGCVGAVIGPPPPIPGVTSGPCGQSTHCEGSVVTEVVWDLIHRDLAGPPFNLDVNTRLNLVTRLHYLGGGNVNFWFTCSPPMGGCNADGGYLNYLAVDDDNGNVADGTPHMSAIFNAFNRHQMACATPTPVNSGCAAALAAPTVSATPLNNGAKVTWNAVSGARKYWVYRADSLQGHGCNFGKERVAITSGTEFIDKNASNGRTYFYTVEAVGPNDSCRSKASNCRSVVPSGSGGLSSELIIVDGSATLTGLSGDGDPFLDNCENARVGFKVQNDGGRTATNVRIQKVEVVSPPGTVITSSFPVKVGNIASCTIAATSFTLQGRGLSFNGTLKLRVELTSNELAAQNQVASGIVEIKDSESDFQLQGSKTFNFDASGNLEGWELVGGTFTQTAPGAPGSPPFHLASSAFADNACDQIRSPLLRLTTNSTLSLQNQFSTEPPLPVFGNVFYDRANVGIFELATGQRTTIAPDGGRLYNASGPNGVCVTEGQRGWAEAGAPFAASNWSATALQAPALAGRIVQLDVAYGTDSLVSLGGFSFDQVTITNAHLQVPDGQSNACGGSAFVKPRDDWATAAVNRQTDDSP